MASIVQQRKLALLHGEANNAKVDPKRAASPGQGSKPWEKDSRSPVKDFRNETKGRNSPLLGRYQFDSKTDTNSTKDPRATGAGVGNSPSKDHANKLNVSENRSPNLGRRQRENKLLSTSPSRDKAFVNDHGSVNQAKTNRGDTCTPQYSSKFEKNVKNTMHGNDKDHKFDNKTKDSERDKTPQKTEGEKKDNLEIGSNSLESKDGEKSKKPTRFAMRKQKRAKRHRSDGFMLALEMGANSSEDEGAPLDTSLGDAINFLQWIRNPTLQNLAKLRRAIKTNDKDWMKEFLEFDGLGLLFQCLKDLGSIQGFHLSDMVLKMECITCIREVVNSQTGLDCLLQIKGRKDNIFGRRFAAGNTHTSLKATDLTTVNPR